MPTQYATVAAPEALLAEARSRTGIDIVDHDALLPLSMLVRSLNSESQLHPAGAVGMQARLVRILSNRLRMQRDFAAHPEIASEKIQEPVFICGMARTGSTKTQKLLAASGDFNWLPYWKVMNPSLFTGDRSESPQPRIDDIEAFARWFDAASPETAAGHAFETHEPEEESFIFEHSLRSATFLGWAPLNGYLEWLFTQDLTAQFIYLRDTLKYLQWQGLATGAKRWVLKCPLYSGLEPLLLKVFPDAHLVMTHRHPLVTMPSALRLLECFHAPYTATRPDPEYFINGQVGAINAHLQIREALPKGTFLDVAFHELVDDVGAVAQRIYDFSGLTLSPDSRQRLVKWNDDNPQHKRGKHSYSLATYGLTEQKIAELFAGYIAFLTHDSML
ncbi:MAG: sulfotransferase [Steroidobacteraceae bacterium]